MKYLKSKRVCFSNGFYFHLNGSKHPQTNTFGRNLKVIKWWWLISKPNRFLRNFCKQFWRHLDSKIPVKYLRLKQKFLCQIVDWTKFHWILNHYCHEWRWGGFWGQALNLCSKNFLLMVCDANAITLCTKMIIASIFRVWFHKKVEGLC